MPTSFTGLLIFVVFLLPGLAFVAVRERNAPGVRRSVFRETAAIAAASALFNVLAVASFMGARTAWPNHTLDITAMIDGGGAYVRDHYLAVSGWAVAVAAASTALAALAGWIVGRRDPHPSKLSAWWLLFDRYKRMNEPATVDVLCGLDDGSWIGGRLDSFNDSAHDDPDRDLVLVEPITHGWSTDADLKPLDVSAVSISARRIVTMLVSYTAPVPTPAAEIDVLPSSPWWHAWKRRHHRATTDALPPATTSAAGEPASAADSASPSVPQTKASDPL